MKTKNLYKYIFADYPDIVNINQMCKMLGGISAKTGYSLLRENKIKFIKIGRSYMVPKINIFEYLQIDENSVGVNPRSCL